MAKGTAKTGPGKGERAPTFEEALARLEEIVEELDDGNVPLARSLELFREGTQLAARCRNLLAEAETTLHDAMAEAEASADDETGITGAPGADTGDGEDGDDDGDDPFR